MDSLQVTDAAAAAVAIAPRVQLQDIENAIAEKYFATGDIVMQGVAIPENHPLTILTLCVVVMKNGFTVIGKSAPASLFNFNPELGRKFAYEDAIRQLWPLMGFALRDRLDAA